MCVCGPMQCFVVETRQPRNLPCCFTKFDFSEGDAALLARRLLAFVRAHEGIRATHVPPAARATPAPGPSWPPPTKQGATPAMSRGGTAPPPTSTAPPTGASAASVSAPAMSPPSTAVAHEVVLPKRNSTRPPASATDRRKHADSGNQHTRCGSSPGSSEPFRAPGYAAHASINAPSESLRRLRHRRLRAERLERERKEKGAGAGL